MAKRNKKYKEADDTLVDIVQVRDSAQDFLEENQNLVFGILVGVVLIIGGFIGYKNFYQKPRNAEATVQMYQAQFQFERDSFAKALTNPGGGYSGFLDIISNYGGTAAANTAKYYAGVSYLYLGNYNEAIEYLKDFSPKGSLTPAMKFGALGDAYSELGDFDTAEDYYEDAANAIDNDLITPYYLLKAAMINEKNGDIESASKYLSKIESDYPESNEYTTAIKYLSKLN